MPRRSPGGGWNRAALAALPEQSFARAYLAYLDENGFDPVAISRLRQETDPVRDRDEGDAWFAARADLLHDLWHVLTGYGTDEAGESMLLGFSRAQGIAASGLRVLLWTAVVMGPKRKRFEFQREIHRALAGGAGVLLLCVAEALVIGLGTSKRRLGARQHGLGVVQGHLEVVGIDVEPGPLAAVGDLVGAVAPDEVDRAAPDPAPTPSLRNPLG